jgi:hypothetical protein
VHRSRSGAERANSAVLPSWFGDSICCWGLTILLGYIGVDTRMGGSLTYQFERVGNGDPDRDVGIC